MPQGMGWQHIVLLLVEESSKADKSRHHDILLELFMVDVSHKLQTIFYE